MLEQLQYDGKGTGLVMLPPYDGATEHPIDRYHEIAAYLQHLVDYAPASLTYHGAKRYGARGVVVDGDEVDEEGGAARHARDEERAHHHLADPVLACESKQRCK